MVEPSIIRQLKEKERKEKSEKQRKRIEKAKESFIDIKEPMTNLPKLSMWESLEKRELDLILNQSPVNVFQEMIQWTESGILWKFPIDNEIGNV